MQTNPYLKAKDPQVVTSARMDWVRRVLRGTWGSSFIPAQFDFCIVSSTLEGAYSVYGDEVGETCIDPDAGTVVRFVRLKAVKIIQLSFWDLEAA